MRIPSSLLTDTVTVTRPVTTGAGQVHVSVADDLPAHITTTRKWNITPTATVSMTVTTLYVKPTLAIREGDQVTLPGGDVITVREISTPRAGRTPATTIVEGW